MAGVAGLEQEPRMTTGRPSSARRQQSGHVVSNVFKSLFSKHSLELDTVKNLTVSRPTDGGYQQQYVDQLKCIEEQRAKRLDELRRVENHLVKAYGAATAADERRLNEREEECRAYRQLGLPSDESELVLCLDEKLLTRHNLLVPSAVRTVEKRETERNELNEMPRYAQATKTSQLHSKVVTNGDSLGFTTTSMKRGDLLFLEELQPIHRHSQREALERLDRPVNFKCNPRLPIDTTCSHLDSKLDNMFVAEPQSVVFEHYEVGYSYETVLQLRNVDNVSRQLRVISPLTQEFKIDAGTFPTDNGLIAPGLSCQYVVTFTPHSLAPCNDFIKVMQPNRHSLVVPIEAHRPTPQLSLSSEWNCGYCLVGGRQVIELECINHGSDSKFRILSPKQPSDIEFVDVGYVLLPPFEIQPATFSIKHLETVYITVIFSPSCVGSFSQPIHLVTESEHVINYTLTGVSEEARVELVKDDSVIQFGDVNAGGNDEHVVYIHNHSHVDLSYHWRICYPLCHQSVTSDALGIEKRVERLSEQANALFSITPTEGKILAEQQTVFTVLFRPLKSGDYCNTADLVLDHVPRSESDDTDQPVDVASLFQWSCIQLSLMGSCLPLCVNISPPVLFLPSRLPFGECHKQQMVLTNCSKSSVKYIWQNMSGPSIITADPAKGTMCVGGIEIVDVLITSFSLDPIDCDLVCLLGDSQTLCLPIRAAVKGVDIVVNAPRLLFGLVRIGQSSTVEVEVSNRSRVSTHIYLSEQHENSSDQVVFTPSCCHVPARGHAVFYAKFKPTQPMHYSAILHCRVENGEDQYVNMYGECQECSAYVDKSRVHFNTMFVDVPTQHQLLLCNQTRLTTKFNWTTCQGEDSKWCDVRMEPQSGELQPGEHRPTTVSVTAMRTGDISHLFVSCHIEDSSHPVYISITATVKGLSVSYATPTQQQLQQGDVCFDENPQLTMECHSCSIDASRCVVVMRNNSALFANFTVEPRHLKPLVDKQILQEELQFSVNSRGTRTSLLTRTPNLADPFSKSIQQSKRDYVCSLLSSNLGAVLIVTPSAGRLSPFEEVNLVVSGYADMWGQYRDNIICQVHGLESVSIPISLSVCGSPLLFVFGLTDQQQQQEQHPTVRFGSHVPDIQPIERIVCIWNRGPVDIRVDWRVFGSCDFNDEQLIDIELFLGDPFPLFAGTEEIESAEHCKNPLVGVRISEHNGVKDNIPITMQPTQLVVPSRSQAAVKVLLRRDLLALSHTETEKVIDAFVLGYMTLSEQSALTPLVTRDGGFGVDPIRLGVSAHIRKPQVSIEVDDEDSSDGDGVVFNMVASSLIKSGQMAGQSLKLQPMMLTNHCQTVLSFQLHTSEPFRITNRDQLSSTVTLRQQASVQVRLGMILNMSLLECCLKIREGEKVDGADLIHTEMGSKLVINRKLCLDYSNGSQQVVPITGYVALPHLEVLPTKLTFSTVLVGTEHSSVFQLKNPSLSDSQWTMQEEFEGDSVSPFSITPINGLLKAHTSHSSSYQITLTCHFCPQRDGYFKSRFTFSGVLLEQPTSIVVEGHSSFDQMYKVNT